MFDDLPDSILLLSKTAIGIALMAYLFVGAKELRWVFGSISLATFFWQADFPCVHVNVSRVATIAPTASVLAVDDDLWSQGEVRPSAISCDVDTISHNAG